MEKIPKFNKRRAFNKAVGLGNVGLAYIPESRVYEYLPIMRTTFRINIRFVCYY